MRIFIALDIADEIRAALTRYVQSLRPLAPDARWARPESWHVTLKFVGEVSEGKVAEMKTVLAKITAPFFDIAIEGVGFFPNEHSSRVFWAGVSAGDVLPQLASQIDETLGAIGIAREKNPYHPHLTLARAGNAPGAGQRFRTIQQHIHIKAAEPPRFGTMSAQEFFLYLSEPGKGSGSYTKLARFGLHTS